MMAIAGAVFTLLLMAGISHQLPTDDDDNYQQFLPDQQSPSVDERLAEVLDQWSSYDSPYSSICEDRVRSVDDWPAADLGLGQIGGVAVTAEGNPVVFHRADVTWTADSFGEDHVYAQKDHGPIADPTILVLDSLDGRVVSARGENKFYLPHGLTIDEEGNYWVTDVAMHQVFKFPPHSSEPSLTLGRAFEPATSNQDNDKFCQPTDVAVASNGDIYVSDGYCASRVVRFDKDGTFIETIGEGELWLPHSLALVEDLDLLCVADRENRSVACYNIGGGEGHGQLTRRYSDPYLGRVFAISYLPAVGLIYGVTGVTEDLDPQGFTLDVGQLGGCKWDFLDAWSPRNQDFYQPHDVAVSPAGDAVYVGEVGPNNVWKFYRN